MNKKKKGFTLIELLAVVVILGLLALITTPIIINLLENSKKNVFKNSVEGLVRVAQLEQNKINFELGTYTVKNGSIFNAENKKLNSSGGTNENGIIYIDEDGKTSLAVNNDKWCAIKESDKNSLTVKDYDKNTCKVGEPLKTVLQTITDKNIAGNTEGLFTDDYGNIRYRGGNSQVKNYTTFNNEVWRIIGILDGKVKLIKETSIGTLSLDSKTTTINWSTSPIQKLLNPNNQAESFNNSLYWDGTKGNCYAGTTGSMSTLQSCDFTSKTLSQTAKDMIDTVTYKTGQPNFPDIASTIYQQEQSDTVLAGYSKVWTGKVALMYMSDYGYAASPLCTKKLYNYADDANCTQTGNWLYKGIYEWTMTAYLTESASILETGNASGGSVYNYSNNSLEIRPTVFLKNDVKIKGGNGTVTSPYILG